MVNATPSLCSGLDPNVGGLESCNDTEMRRSDGLENLILCMFALGTWNVSHWPSCVNQNVNVGIFRNDFFVILYPHWPASRRGQCIFDGLDGLRFRPNTMSWSRMAAGLDAIKPNGNWVGRSPHNAWSALPSASVIFSEVTTQSPRGEFMQSRISALQLNNAGSKTSRINCERFVRLSLVLVEGRSFAKSSSSASIARKSDKSWKLARMDNTFTCLWKERG